MKIFLDENLSEHVATALNYLNKGYFQDFEVHSTKEKFGRGAKDEIIIPGIGKLNSILITKDINIHRTQLQYELCQQYGLGIFFIRLPKGQDKHWELVKLLISNWEEILSKTARERKPFAFKISVRGKMEKL